MIGRIGKYTVEKELGQGGFGKVYLALDPDVGQHVAIKKLLAEGDPDLLKRFQLEIHTTAALRHKNIVTIHASGEDQGHPYLVMEFLEGRTLKQIIQGRVPLSLLEKVRIMTQVAEGLAYAHSKGVVHRDVKPENIMLLPDDNVKIMDFGIALGPNRNTNVTQTGGIIGTPSYFAPEQLEGYKANEQTDIFSFGDVFYELLTGIHPFEQYKNDWKTLQIAIISYEPRSISELLAGCPEALETLVHRTLAKEPAFRYRTFEEVQLDAEAILVDLKHEGAAAILQEVAPLLESGNLQNALSKIQQAYRLEPGNRKIRRLREEINLRVQQEEVHTRVAGLLADAETQMSERRYAEALQNLEMCAKLDTSNVVVGARLKEAKARLEAATRANRLVSEARFHEQKGLLTEAHQRLEEALSLAPDHTDALRLRQRVGEELERRVLDQQRQQAIRAARDHVAAKRFAQALAILDEIERAQPGAGGVPELRADIQHEQAEEERRLRAEKFNLALARTREAMQTPDLERASQMVDYLCANFADEPGAGDVLPGLQARLEALVRARETAQIQQKIRTLLREKSFREALDVLAEALQRFPDDAGLERLRKSAEDLYRAHQRAEAIAAVLNRATSRRDQGDAQGALDIILEGSKSLGKEAAFADLANQLEMEIEQQRYGAALEKLLKGSGELMAAGRYTEAIDRLEGAREFGGESEVRALLDSARAAAAIHEERRYVEETLAAIEKLQSASAWGEALKAAEKGRSQYPHNLSLVQTANRLRDRVMLEGTRAEIERRRSLIRKEIEASRWNAATEALRLAREEFPGDRAFDDLAERVNAGLYEEGWRALEARVQEALNANALSQALRSLENESTRTTYASDPRWQALLREIGQRREYEEGLLEAERRRKAGSLSEAEHLLTAIIDQGPHDKRAQQLRGAIQAQHSEAVRQQEIARITQEIRGHLTRDDLARTASALKAARTRFPGENIWNELQSAFDQRQQSLGRQADLSAAEEGVRQALGRDDMAQATAILTAARSKFPDEAALGRLEADVSARRAAAKRQTDVSAAETAVRQSLSRDDTAQASALLNAARARYPEEPLWTALEAEINARQSALQRERDLSAVAESIRRRLNRDHAAGLRATAGAARRNELLLRRGEDLPPAIAELEAARAKYPGDPLWDALRGEIEARRALLNAEQAIAERVDQCLERGDAAQAEAQLNAARAQYPDEVFWDLFLAGIEERLKLLKQRAEVAGIEERVRERLQGNDLQGAQKALATGRAQYPNEPAWIKLQAEVEARRQALQLDAARTEAAANVRRSLDEGIQKAFHAEPEAPVPYPVKHLWDALASAARKLDEARKKCPGDAFWETLRAEIDQRRSQLEGEVRDSVRNCRTLDAIDWYAKSAASALATYPGDAFLKTLQADIAARLGPLEVASQAECEARVRESLKQGDLATAQVHLSAARSRHPRAGAWAELQAEIDARRAGIARQAEVAAAGDRIRACCERDDLEQAIAELNAARAKYPGEALWANLKAEIDGRVKEIEDAGKRAEAFLEQGRPEEAVALIEARFARQSRLADLLTRARQARDLAKRREARNRDHERLLAIQRQIAAESRKRKRNELDREAQGVAAGYSEDREMAALAAAIHAQTEVAVAAAPAATRKPTPWKLIGSVAAAVAASVILVLALHKKPAPAPSPPAPSTTIAVEIRSDPPGATLSVGGHSCITPNCRLDLAPGSYPAAAQLAGYEPKQQTLVFDSLHRTADLTLQPMAPPPTTEQTTGTMVVQTALPDVLVYVDGHPRSRTDQSGSVSLAVESHEHEVRVERNGYESPASKQVNIVAGGRQSVAFKLTPQKARLELDGAPANVELRVDGNLLGRTDGSAGYAFRSAVPSGDHTLTVVQGLLQGARGPAARTITEHFDPGQTARLLWKAEPAAPTPVPPPAVVKNTTPTPEELEDRDWEKVKDTNDPAKLAEFRKTYPNGKHKGDADAAADRIAWAGTKKDSPDSLRAYVQNFPAGAHKAEASLQIADLAWKSVDKSKTDQVLKFLEENPKSPHAVEAQKLIDTVNIGQNVRLEVLKTQVLDVLNSLDQALQKKQNNQIKAVWPKVSRAFLDSLGQAQQQISLTAQGAPALLDGYTGATVLCTLHTSLPSPKDQNATLTLHYSGGRWLIDGLKVTQ